VYYLHTYTSLCTPFYFRYSTHSMMHHSFDPKLVKLISLVQWEQRMLHVINHNRFQNESKNTLTRPACNIRCAKCGRSKALYNLRSSKKDLLAARALGWLLSPHLYITFCTKNLLVYTLHSLKCTTFIWNTNHYIPSTEKMFGSPIYKRKLWDSCLRWPLF
jgi:hypothetical protein